MRPSAASALTTVAAVRTDGGAPEATLDDALDAVGLWSMLRTRCASRRRRRAALRIAIKPDLDVFVPGTATGTDPALVDALIARLRGRGFATVSVCDGRNRRDDWLHNRDALCVPDLLGYAFEAPRGTSYDVVWVDDAPAVVATSASDHTDALRVNAAWAGADFRISFAKAKTDDAWGYALTAANVLGLVSRQGAAAQWAAEDRALHVLRRVPPDLALIDAVVGSHGRAGSSIACPIATETIIASPNALLADWICALKMGADPHASPLNALALERIGLPPSWSLIGDAAPWPAWTNPAPTLREATRGRARWPELDALARAVLQPVDRERFAFRDVLVERISVTLLDRLDRVTDVRVRDGLVGLLARALALLGGARAAFVANVAKGDVVRSEAPVSADVDGIRRRCFDDTPAIVDSQARALDGVPADARGFRFRTIGGHIQFAASRVLPVSFDDFVARVHVSAAIRHMNDYVGGSWTVVDRDADGRPLRQVERNVYLPQPNWVGVFGGEPIDVEKVERMAYTADRHDIWWRTIGSANESAESDDGAVSFLRTAAGEVDIHVFARQRFRLPTALAVARVERWPRVHRELVAEAYERFFEGTIANFRAAYDGRPFRIGQPAATGAAAEPSDVRAVLTGALDVAARLFGWGAGSASAVATDVVAPLLVDEWGFAHFAGAGDASVTTVQGSAAGGPLDRSLTPAVFFSELARAVRQDLAAGGLGGMPDGSAT